MPPNTLPIKSHTGPNLSIAHANPSARAPKPAPSIVPISLTNCIADIPPVIFVNASSSACLSPSAAGVASSANESLN